MSDNPFERWDLDPLAGPQAITEALRERVEDATDEHERAAIREDWEALTLHPRRRVELALLAHPETRPRGPERNTMNVLKPSTFVTRKRLRLAERLQGKGRTMAAL